MAQLVVLFIYVDICGWAICRTCSKQGHNSTVCNSTKATITIASSPPVSSLSDSGCDAPPVSVVMTVSSDSDYLWYESCAVGDSVVNFLFDTDSQATILPYSLAVKSGLTVSRVSSAVLRVYGGGKVDVLGKIRSAIVTFNGQSHSGDILVTANDTRPNPGMDSLSSLQFVRECAPLTKSSSGFVVSFRLQHDVKTDGMCYPSKSLPFSMKTLFEVETKRLLAAGIIYPVSNPVVSAPIIPVVKQVGAARPIRICGDYLLTLNKLIDRDSYTLPRMEEILHKVNGATVNSILDFTAGCFGSSKSASYLYFNSFGTFRAYKIAICNLSCIANFSRSYGFGLI